MSKLQGIICALSVTRNSRETIAWGIFTMAFTNTHKHAYRLQYKKITWKCNQYYISIVRKYVGKPLHIDVKYMVNGRRCCASEFPIHVFPTSAYQKNTRPRPHPQTTRYSNESVGIFDSHSLHAGVCSPTIKTLDYRES